MGLSLDREAHAVIAALPPPTKRRIREALRRLDADPFDDALDLKLLATRGQHRFYRCRMQSYRIVHSVTGRDVDVHRVFHRRDGYGWRERPCKFGYRASDRT